MDSEGEALYILDPFIEPFGIRVDSKEELEARIYQYFDEINEDPVVFHWKYKLDEISQD